MTLVAISIMASALYVVPNASAQAGPRLSYHKFLTIKTPDAQVKAMKLGQIQMYPGLIRPGDVDELSAAGKQIVATPGGHFCYLTFNLREYDVGGEIGAGYEPTAVNKRCLLDVDFRHAIAHLVPKEVLIGTIFKYIVVRVDTVIPPQMAQWSDPNIPIHNFAPGDPFTSTPADHDAVGILKAGGYYFQDRGTIGSVDASDYWSYDAAGDEALGHISFLSPSYEEAPTSYTIVQTTASEIRAIGLNNVEHAGINFTDMLNSYVYPNTFDMFFLCWSGLSNDPDNLWAFFHSVNDAYQGRNHPGTHVAIIDELTEVVHNSLDLDAVKAAAFECQELLMSPDVPYGMSYIPIYSRNYFDAYDANLEGIVNSPFVGSNNGWTLLNMHWGAGGPADNGLIEVVGTDVLTLNPLVSNSADEVNVWGSMFDGLIGGDPYTTNDVATGMASYFAWEAYTGNSPVGPVEGMVFHFTLKPGIKWHCGVDFTVEDVVFCMDYLAANEPALWTDAWENYVGVDPIEADPLSFDIYYNRTSLWLKDGLSGYVCLLPKHIWNDANRDGVEGDPVTDWQHHNVWALTHPPVDGVVPKVPGTAKDMTCLDGTGAWVFEELNLPGGWSQVRANPNYYLTQTQVETYMTDLFHWYGNVNTGEETPERVDIQDVALEGLAWGSYPTMPAPSRWDQRCDLVADNFIDAEDLRVVGAAYGKPKVYP